MNKLSSMIAIFLITLIFNGCATMQGKWEEAAKQDTIGAYNYFLRTAKPDAGYKNKAETRIKELKEAQKENEEASAFKFAQDNSRLRSYNDDYLESFLSKYPSGKHAPEARKLIEKRVYDRAIKENYESYYSNFLSRFPNSDLVPDVTARLRKVRYDRARKSESLGDYENFIKWYPQGQDTSELENDLPRVRKLEQTRELKKRKFEQAKELGEVALRMAPVITAPTKRMPAGTIMQSVGMAKVGSPADLKYQMNRFRKLLEDGADPSLIRIDGFQPVYMYGPGSFSFGNPGKVVSSEYNGMKLWEYFNIINLKEASDLLKKYGGK